MNGAIRHGQVVRTRPEVKQNDGIVLKGENKECMQGEIREFRNLGS